MAAFAGSSPSLQSTPPPKLCLQEPPVVPRQTLCTVRLVVPRGCSLHVLLNQFYYVLPLGNFAGTYLPQSKTEGPSFRRSHSCFSDLFVHARSNGISIVHPDLQLISFVCICGREYIRGWRLQDNLRCHFLGNVHLLVETGSHWSRTLLAG